MSATITLRGDEAEVVKVRKSAIGNTADVLADIYRDDTHIAVWQRTLSSHVSLGARQLPVTSPHLQRSMTVTPENVYSSIVQATGSGEGIDSLVQDISYLVDMFCCLFELNQVGLRLVVLDQAMCPRFHVDQVPCRLITTYHGQGTQWLAHQAVDRRKLGTRSQGKSDEQSGLYGSQRDICQLNRGDVALLKGERWVGNENAGLVHRSPQVQADESRLLLTLDFAEG